jgi:uncharacterized protein (TIGR03905 family)
VVFKTKGVCAQEIHFDVENNIIQKVEFIRGCNGSLQAIGKLVEGMAVDTAIQKIKGIQCGGKGTSCPDQLAQALADMKA